MKTILLLFTSSVLASAACVPVDEARVVAADLKDVSPLFDTLDPAMPLGFAPLPGTQRILRARDLTRLLQRYGITVAPGPNLPDVCIERLVRPIDITSLRAALVFALGVEDAEIDILDFSRQLLPAGRLEFHRENLNRPSEASAPAPVVWRGKLVYDQDRSVSVWAQVRISAERTWFAASENIPAGAVIGSKQIQRVTGRQWPDSTATMLQSEMIAGKVARRSIAVGERFAPRLLSDPADIQTGDQVHVSVMEGQAWLSLDAVAHSSGRKGDTILVHNPASGRTFRAVVQARGEVAVRPSPGA